MGGSTAASALAVIRAGLTAAPAPVPADSAAVWSWLEARRLAPLAAAPLRAALAPAAEGAALAPAIRRVYRENLARSLYLAVAAQQALERLAEAGLTALTFKGPALALEAYGGLDQRGFDDIDILVARDAVPAALEALAEAGWTARLALTGWQRDAYIRSFAALELTRTGDGAQLDLHWRFSESWFPVRMPVAAMLARRLRLATEGGVPTELCTLAPADHLAVIAVHAAKHAWREPRLVVDFAALAARLPAAAWPAVVAAARAGGYGRILALNFALARQLLGTVPPAAAADLLEDPAVAALTPELAARCLEAEVDPGAPPPWRLLARMRERRRDRWRGTAALLFSLTPRDWELARLPRALAWLYYPLRFGRLAARLLAAQPTGRTSSR